MSSSACVRPSGIDVPAPPPPHRAALERHVGALRIPTGRAPVVAAVLACALCATLHPVAAGIAGTLLVPWALWRSTRVELRTTSCRGARFDFDGSLGGMYLWALAVPFGPLAIGAALASLAHATGSGALWTGAAVAAGVVATVAISPWSHERLAAYTLRGCRHDRARFPDRLPAKRFHAIYARAFALAFAVAALPIAAVGATGPLTGAFPDASFGAMRSARAGLDPALAFVMISAYPLTLFGGLLLTVRFQARVRTHLLGAAALDADG